MRALLLILTLATPYLAWSKTYFLSQAFGDDRNEGTSTNRAWKSLARLQGVPLTGANVLLAGGETFHGNIVISNAEPAHSPTVIGSFGSGRATIRPGQRNGIELKNIGSLSVENLLIHGEASSSNAYGVLIENTRRDGMISGVHMTNVEVRGFGKHGVLITGEEFGFNNVLVEHCILRENTRGGMEIAGKLPWDEKRYAHSNVVVRNCHAYANSGDPNFSRNHSGSGIVLYQVDGGLIESCAAWNNGALCPANGGGPVGIWTCASRHVCIQFCESFDNKSRGLDGGGFDIDGGSEGCVLQFNYTHDNMGPGLMLYTYPYASHSDRDNIIRFNISINDAMNGPAVERYAGLWVRADGRTMSGAKIYNNTVLNQGAAAAVYGEGVEAVFQNNILLTSGSRVPLRVEDGHDKLQFLNNLYWRGGAPFQVRWNGRDYRTMDEWRAGARQETFAGKPCGFFIDPDFSIPAVKAPANSLLNFTPLAALRSSEPELLRKGIFPAEAISPDGLRDFFQVPQKSAVPLGAIGLPN